MTQDEMIDLAKQAGWQYAHGESGFEPLWNFAKLVAAKEREAAIKIIKETSFSNWFQADVIEAIKARGCKHD